MNFSKLISFGDGYAKQKVIDLRNPFWSDILNSWKGFINNTKIENLTEILYSPIWFNSNLLRGENLFIKNWYEKVLRTIIDLLNYNGDFYAFDEFKGMLNVQGAILDFQSVISKIPNGWKIKMNNFKNECRSLKYNKNQK